MTRNGQQIAGAIFVALAALAGIAGALLYSASKPTLDDSASNVATSMAQLECTTDGTVCPTAHYVSAQPMFLWVGLGCAALFLVVATVLFVTASRTRPSVVSA